MKLMRQFKKTEYLVLLAIIGFNLYIRLWDITHLFKWVYDYDEGAYSLGGRFISQGYLPYKDFVLVHPPLYDLALALIYKIFGYNFMYGRYFSVFLSVVCLILAYLIMKKLYNSAAGLIAAAFFALFPGFSLLWYRVVQEPLGIFWILAAIYFATDYILCRKFSYRILISGVCFGLAIATKYTFIPAVAGSFVGLAILSLQGRWRTLYGWFNREIWLLAAGIVTGFLLITGFFMAIDYRGFFHQTFSSQIDYRIGNIPLQSVINTLSPFQINWGKTIDTACIYLVILTLIALLIRRRFSGANLFLFTGSLISLLLSSVLNQFGEVRYFTSPFIFTLLSISNFVPALDFQSLARKMTFQTLKYSTAFIVSLILLVFCATGLLFLLRYDYNYMGPDGITFEEQVYRQTIDYLEKIGAKKVYSLDPIIPALSPKINSTLDFDTFGFLEVLKQSPEDILKREKNDGADYYVIDALPRLFGLTRSDFGYLALDTSQSGKLVKTLVPGQLTLFEVDVYAAPGLYAQAPQSTSAQR